MRILYSKVFCLILFDRSELYNDSVQVVYKCYNDPRESEAAKKHAELEQASAMETFEASKQPSHLLVNVILVKF